MHGIDQDRRDRRADVLSRGAQKRRAARRHAARAAVRALWTRRLTQPGVLVFAAAVALALAGWLLVFRAGARVPVRAATLGGLHLELEEARWVLDQMDHGENFAKPSVMMPDMPEWGKQRVTLDLALENRSQTTQIYDGLEFVLRPEIGTEVPPSGALIGRAPLAPGQSLNTALHFDFDTTEPHGKLRVAWQRDGRTVYLPIPEPAEHYHLRPRVAEGALPPDARLLLPIGKADRGRALYDATYGCIACHGDPSVPGSNNVGPHLAGIAAAGATRVEGMSSAQYLYQSILEPGAVIAPACKDGKPCAVPTAMPEYGSLVTLQDAADLLAYLLRL